MESYRSGFFLLLILSAIDNFLCSSKTYFRDDSSCEILYLIWLYDNKDNLQFSFNGKFILLVSQMSHQKLVASF